MIRNCIAFGIISENAVSGKKFVQRKAWEFIPMLAKGVSDMAEQTLPKGISVRKDGRYQARYTLDGKRYAIYGKTLKEVEKRLRDIKYEMDHGIYAKPEKITVNVWYWTWMNEYRKNMVRESTLNSYKYYYKHVEDMIGKMKLQLVRPEHIQKILNRMKNNGYSVGYIEKVKALMNLLFRQAYLNGIIVINPVERTILPKGGRRENIHKRALTEEEQRRFLEQAEKEKPFHEAMFFLGFSTGMRIGEITALEWSDIDFEKMEIHISGTLVNVAGMELHKGPTKTEHSRRMVPMLPEIARRLKKHKREQAKLRMKLGDKWEAVKGLEDLVFTSMMGRPLWSASVAKFIKEIIDGVNLKEEMAAGLEKREAIRMEYFCPHAMRHTFATRALEKGIPPKVVQSYLGHSRIDVTLDIYTHVTAELEKEEIKKIEHQFKQA